MANKTEEIQHFSRLPSIKDLHYPCVSKKEGHTSKFQFLGTWSFLTFFQSSCAFVFAYTVYTSWNMRPDGVQKPFEKHEEICVSDY